jgi:hypothetical protein
MIAVEAARSSVSIMVRLLSDWRALAWIVGTLLIYILAPGGAHSKRRIGQKSNERLSMTIGGKMIMSSFVIASQLAESTKTDTWRSQMMGRSVSGHVRTQPHSAFSFLFSLGP